MVQLYLHLHQLQIRSKIKRRNDVLYHGFWQPSMRHAIDLIFHFIIKNLLLLYGFFALIAFNNVIYSFLIFFSLSYKMCCHKIFSINAFVCVFNLYSFNNLFILFNSLNYITYNYSTSIYNYCNEMTLRNTLMNLSNCT